MLSRTFGEGESLWKCDCDHQSQIGKSQAIEKEWMEDQIMTGVTITELPKRIRQEGTSFGGTDALWPKIGKNTDRIAIQSFTVPRVSGASERANGRASGPVLTSLFLFVPDHSALFSSSFAEAELKGKNDHDDDDGEKEDDGGKE